MGAVQDDTSEVTGREVIFGLVSPVGTEDKRVIEALTQALDSVKYKLKDIRLSDFLTRIDGLPTPFDNTDDYQRINSLMSRGDELRSKLKDGSALARASVIGIQDYRKTLGGDKSKPLYRQAFVLKSLKHPDEVELLRKIYGRSFWLVSIYSPENKRKAFLSKRIKSKRYDNLEPTNEVNQLIKRDQDESDTYGQNVRKTFPLGDVFIDADLETLQTEMTRFVNLVFGYPYSTPTLDEYGMYLAQASALMSSSLARQVGASIMGKNGSVIATGTNEVPFYEGGVCNENMGKGFREFDKEQDSNDEQKRKILGDFLKKLSEQKWLSTEKENKNTEDLVEEALTDPELKNAQLMNITEFGREVHAEMTALMEASRKSVSVEQCTLYCTTFPCHVCAKHIIASGLKKVIFIEPYHKSLAEPLFDDFINVDDRSESPIKIKFDSFVGIAPRRYMDIFRWVTRKQDNRKKMDWSAINANPRFGEEPPAITKKEDNASSVFLMNLEKNGMKLKDE